jgi:hypothetical protein
MYFKVRMECAGRAERLCERRGFSAFLLDDTDFEVYATAVIWDAIQFFGHNGKLQMRCNGDLVASL